jgi:hypothetical protein
MGILTMEASNNTTPKGNHCQGLARQVNLDDSFWFRLGTNGQEGTHADSRGELFGVPAIRRAPSSAQYTPSPSISAIP